MCLIICSLGIQHAHKGVDEGIRARGPCSRRRGSKNHGQELWIVTGHHNLPKTGSTSCPLLKRGCRHSPSSRLDTPLQSKDRVKASNSRSALEERRSGSRFHCNLYDVDLLVFWVVILASEVKGVDNCILDAIL
jgi:hypothetical protein